MARKYSRLYKKIVKEERDVVGHIAYALYKEAKIKHIEDYKSRHNDEEPDEDYLEHFHNIACLDAEVSRYRIQATGILQDFIQNTIEEATSKMEKENEDKELRIRREMDDIKPKSFIYGVGQSALGSLFLMLALAAMMFFFIMSSHEYTFTIGNGGVKKIQETEVEAPLSSPPHTEESEAQNPTAAQ